MHIFIVLMCIHACVVIIHVSLAYSGVSGIRK
jgi:hypothetical protein